MNEKDQSRLLSEEEARRLAKLLYGEDADVWYEEIQYKYGMAVADKRHFGNKRKDTYVVGKITRKPWQWSIFKGEKLTYKKLGSSGVCFEGAFMDANKRLDEQREKMQPFYEFAELAREDIARSMLSEA